MSNTVPFSLLANGEIAEELGSRFKARRKSLGYSRRELAARSDTSVATVARFENQGTTTIEVLLKVARALNCLHEFENILAAPVYRSIEEYLEDESV
ncbi:helix-turn-helix domain-containing protein [bacterium]|nr:helix-turn-helix domain-containing protein [bacterium]